MLKKSFRIFKKGLNWIYLLALSPDAQLRLYIKHYWTSFSDRRLIPQLLYYVVLSRVVNILIIIFWFLVRSQVLSSLKIRNRIWHSVLLVSTLKYHNYNLDCSVIRLSIEMYITFIYWYYLFIFSYAIATFLRCFHNEIITFKCTRVYTIFIFII